MTRTNGSKEQPNKIKMPPQRRNRLEHRNLYFDNGTADVLSTELRTGVAVLYEAIREGRAISLTCASGRAPACECVPARFCIGLRLAHEYFIALTAINICVRGRGVVFPWAHGTTATVARGPQRPQLTNSPWTVPGNLLSELATVRPKLCTPRYGKELRRVHPLSPLSHTPATIRCRRMRLEATHANAGPEPRRGKVAFHWFNNSPVEVARG